MTNAVRLLGWALIGVFSVGCSCSNAADGLKPPDAGVEASTDTGTAVDARNPDAGDASDTMPDASNGTDAGDAGAGTQEVPQVGDFGSNVVARRIVLDNQRGEPVTMVRVEPMDAGPHPAVLLLHGSGGLFRMPQVTDSTVCSPRLEAQFERWARRLSGLGFVVLLPDSFGSRGFCDYNDDARVTQVYPSLAVDTEGKTRNLVARLYDADAAIAHLATRANVDANEITVMGFSNGASTTMLYAHHRLSAALDEFRDENGGQALGVAIPTLPTRAAVPARAIAYYPGCGFDGLLPFSTSLSNVDRFYYPVAPLRVQHAALDPLLGHCSLTQTGTREQQADSYASNKAVADRYDITVYDGASHGFDTQGCELSDIDPDPDRVACRQALAVTLTLLGAN